MKVSRVMSEKFARIEPGASFDDAARIMDEEDVRHLPVLDGDELVGVLSDRDLLEASGWLPKAVRDVIEAPGGTVGDIMHRPVASVSPTDSLRAATMRLLDWGIGCLAVLDDARMVGILTETDVLRAYADACGEGRIESDPKVSERMKADVVTAEADTPAEEAVLLMRERHIRHLPVLEGGALCGIVSDRDLRLLVGRGQLEGTPLGDTCARILHDAAPDEPLSKAAGKLAGHRIGALPVVEAASGGGKGRLVGILGTVDVLRHCVEAFARV